MLPTYLLLLTPPGPLTPTLTGTEYNIYSNDNDGGAVDYLTPIDSVSGTTYTTAVLGQPSDNTFAVRAFDSATGFEEANTDCRVRIVIDAAGNDITGLPLPPAQLAARATSGGGARVSWTHNPNLGTRGASAPTAFKVWLTAGSSVNYAASPAATVAYVAGRYLWYADLTGLSDGVTYSIGVRATNAIGDEENTLKATIDGDTTGPDSVDDLTLSAA